jgi:hypothetical protein
MRPMATASARSPHARAAAVLIAAVLAGCAVPGRMAEPQGMGPTEARQALLRVLPPTLQDCSGWAADVHAALAVLALPSTPENLCAVLAFTEQESGYRADPAVPGLLAIAWQEIERRAGRPCARGWTGPMNCSTSPSRPSSTA